MKKLLCFLGGALLLLKIYGQEVQTLSIGDKVPDIVLNNVVNYGASTIKLTDFKGKWIVFDFWATWCSSCVQGMPKMDSLQSEFKDSLQFLLINPKLTRDSLYKITRVKNRMDSILGKKFSIPIIPYDTVATNLFKFHSLPHYIWMDQNRIIRAITHKADVNEKNIRAMLGGAPVSLPVKIDSF